MGPAVATEPLPTFQQAFESAKETHVAEAEKAAAAAPVADPVETETETEREPEPAKASTTKAGKADPAKAESTSDLISDKDFETLQAKHANDPVAFRRALTETLTASLSGERATLEKVKPYAELIDAFEASPERTLTLLAQQYGLDIVKRGETPAAPAAKAESTEAAASATTDAVLATFKKNLGPDFEYLAEGLAPAIKGLVEQLTQTTVEKATEPFKREHETLQLERGMAATDATMKAFGEAHPDWQKHEDAMMAEAETLDPKGLTEAQYLDKLYSLVTRADWEKTRDAQIADGVKAAIEKMNKSAQSTETRTRATPERSVKVAPGKTPTFQEAFEAARRGERFD